MTRKTRIELLHRLMEASIPISEAVSCLAELGWEADEDLVELRSEHCSKVISQFVRGEISRAEVEAWANAIECREDVRFESALVGEVLHELANPVLTFPLGSARAEFLFFRLQNAG